MYVALTGVGSGRSPAMTREAKAAIEAADCVIGARRLLEQLPPTATQSRIEATRPDQILSLLKGGKHQRYAVLYSGDSGFYSGCRGLLLLLRQEGIQAQVLPGISSVQLLSAALKQPWQDWLLVSAHGTACDPVAAVMEGRPAFFLTGGGLGPSQLCAQLTQAGLGELSVAVGEDLGTPSQKLTTTTAQDCAQRTFSPLCVLLAQPAPLGPRRAPGWPDSWFLRDGVPMTKQLVRAAILAKLAPSPGEIFWDVGAGTGSVSVELAAASRGGHVYAVECDPRACALICANREKFSAWNMTVTEGRAPQALESLPRPDAVFIGGTRGEMDGIIGAVLDRNPRARLCVSAIAVESLNAAFSALTARGIPAQVTQVAASCTRIAGGLHLMQAENPIFLITGNCDD